MEHDNPAERRISAIVILGLSLLTLFAGIGPASAQINGTIGVITSLLSFYIGFAQARKDDPVCLLSFIVSGAGIYVVLSQMLGR